MQTCFRLLKLPDAYKKPVQKRLDMADAINAMLECALLCLLSLPNNDKSYQLVALRCHFMHIMHIAVLAPLYIIEMSWLRCIERETLMFEAAGYGVIDMAGEIGALDVLAGLALSCNGPQLDLLQPATKVRLTSILHIMLEHYIM